MGRIGKHSSATWILCSTGVYLLSGDGINDFLLVTHLRLCDQAIIDCLQQKISALETNSKLSGYSKFISLYDQLSFCPILKEIN